MAKVHSPITLNNVATQNTSFVTQNLERSIEHSSHKYLSHEFSKSARRETSTVSDNTASISQMTTQKNLLCKTFDW